MRRQSNRSSTYAVALDSDADSRDVRTLAQYLSTLHSAGCEVLVIDGSDPEVFDEHHRVLRWVARHQAVLPHCRFLDGRVDLVQAATELATTEKVIVAGSASRYTAGEVQSVSDLLDWHDVVEPEEYVEPLPWWGGVDAGSVLVHRGADQVRQARATFAFRREAFRSARDLTDRSGRNDSRRLALQGAHVHQAREVFVRREPGTFGTWWRLRPREASAELVAPVKTAFFLAIVPLLVVLAILSGAGMAGATTGAIAIGSVMIALRGRAGAGRFFPLRACLFAPLWIVERSLSVYWALFDRLRGATVHAVTASPLRSRASVASGEQAHNA